MATPRSPSSYSKSGASPSQWSPKQRQHPLTKGTKNMRLPGDVLRESRSQLSKLGSSSDLPAITQGTATIFSGTSSAGESLQHSLGSSALCPVPDDETPDEKLARMQAMAAHLQVLALRAQREALEFQALQDKTSKMSVSTDSAALG